MLYLLFNNFHFFLLHKLTLLLVVHVSSEIAPKKFLFISNSLLIKVYDPMVQQLSFIKSGRCRDNNFLLSFHGYYILMRLVPEWTKFLSPFSFLFLDHFHGLLETLEDWYLSYISFSWIWIFPYFQRKFFQKNKTRIVVEY